MVALGAAGMSWFDLAMASLAGMGGVVATVQLRLWIRNWTDGRVDTFAAIERHGLELLRRIEAAGFHPDFVLGIGRSGAFLAGWLAGNLGSVAIEVVDRMHQTDPTEPVEFPDIAERMRLLTKLYGQHAKVLIVEGAATRGNTFMSFEKVRRGHAGSWECRYAVLYEVETNIARIDFAARRLKSTPLRYPWHTTARYRSFLRLGNRA